MAYLPAALLLAIALLPSEVDAQALNKFFILWSAPQGADEYIDTMGAEYGGWTGRIVVAPTGTTS